MKKPNETSYEMLRRYAKGNSPYVKLVKERLRELYTHYLGEYESSGLSSDRGKVLVLHFVASYLKFDDLFEEFRQRTADNDRSMKEEEGAAS